MVNDVLISPSILSADSAHLADDLKAIESADYIHIDVMDGHFVPEISFGPAIVKACKANSSVPCDVHLMITNPDEVAESYAKAGADIVTFHQETAVHAHRTISSIHDAGAKAGMAINPGTPVGMLESLIEDLDLVLIMSVNPGFGGQKFIPNALRKVRQTKALCNERKVSPIIEVDGGVTASNAADICAAGANMLVAGSAVYGKEDRGAAIADIRSAGQSGLRRFV